MWDHLLAIGFIVFLAWGVWSGMGRGQSPRIWSGDTQEAEDRRNNRVDSNYRGHDHWTNPADRGW